LQVIPRDINTRDVTVSGEFPIIGQAQGSELQYAADEGI
jgi:hypothetical protein